MKRKFIIDTDCGFDDAMAIMMAIVNFDIEILAITCVNGNTTVDNVVRNVFRTLDACGCREVSVYKGADKPIMGKYLFKICEFHGSDGFGDVFHDSVSEFKVQQQHAVNLLIEVVKDNPGEITLVTLGPLTNIALAIRLDSSFSRNVKEIYMMGGNTEGQGNITVSAEANFHYDPEAAYIVLNEMKCPITITAWELCLRNSVTWDWRNELLNSGTKKAELIKLIEHSVEKNSIDLYPGYILCDQFAMAAALKEECVSCKSGPYYVTVEPQGHYTRGQMIIDKAEILNGNRNTYVIESFDMDLVKNMIHHAISTK